MEYDAYKSLNVDEKSVVRGCQEPHTVPAAPQKGPGNLTLTCKEMEQGTRSVWITFVYSKTHLHVKLWCHAPVIQVLSGKPLQLPEWTSNSCKAQAGTWGQRTEVNRRRRAAMHFRGPAFFIMAIWHPLSWQLLHTQVPMICEILICSLEILRVVLAEICHFTNIPSQT